MPWASSAPFRCRLILILNLPGLLPLANCNTLTVFAAAPTAGYNACGLIAASVSNASQVFYPGQDGYDMDIFHWAISSTEESQCSVEPGTTEDVAMVLTIIGATRTSFAVKGGGHSTNPGFSSTFGVQIDMSRFSGVFYDAAAGTVDVGAGMVWDDVYAALDPLNVTTVGGRVAGIGVAGFALGGGYSFHTNQYGLCVDSITAYELVKPDGEIVTVTQMDNPDLFFGLKGGYNNFGIVTKFTFKTFPQEAIWGGILLYAESQVDTVTAAVFNFVGHVTDPKASIIATYTIIENEFVISVLVFYDAVAPPSAIFDEFLAIPSILGQVGTTTLGQLVPTLQSPIGQRVTFNSLPLHRYTPAILNAFADEALLAANNSKLTSTLTVQLAVEPFLPQAFHHNPYPTAYPPTRTPEFMPSNIYFAWSDPDEDDAYRSYAVEVADRLRALAEQEARMDGDNADTKLESAPRYPNYAINGTPLVDIYGENVQRLKEIKAIVDPWDVMGLAGGFKF